MKSTLAYQGKALPVPCHTIVSDAVLAPRFVQSTLGLDPAQCDVAAAFHLIKTHLGVVNMSIPSHVQYHETLCAHQIRTPGAWLVLLHLQNDSRIYQVGSQRIEVKMTPGDLLVIGERVTHFKIK